MESALSNIRHYQSLGLKNTGASLEEVKRAYKKLSLQLHVPCLSLLLLPLFYFCSFFCCFLLPVRFLLAFSVLGCGVPWWEPASYLLALEASGVGGAILWGRLYLPMALPGTPSA